MTPKAPLTRLAHRNLPLPLLQAREAVIANFRPLLHARAPAELIALRGAPPPDAE